VMVDRTGGARFYPAPKLSYSSFMAAHFPGCTVN
jgi:hypothetical protein